MRIIKIIHAINDIFRKNFIPQPGNLVITKRDFYYHRSLDNDNIIKIDYVYGDIVVPHDSVLLYIDSSIKNREHYDITPARFHKFYLSNESGSTFLIIEEYYMNFLKQKQKGL